MSIPIETLQSAIKNGTIDNYSTNTNVIDKIKDLFIVSCSNGHLKVAKW